MTACPSRVYVIHFDRTYRSGRHHGARNYTGIALDGDVQRRLGEHLDIAACQRAGHHLPSRRGSPLVCAVLRAGVAVRVVLDVPGDRKLERRWKARHATRICPECAPRRRGGGPLASSAPACRASRRWRWRRSGRRAHAA